MARSKRNRDEDGSPERGQGSGFGTGWWLSAGIMGLVAVMAIGVLIGRSFAGGDETDTAGGGGGQNGFPTVSSWTLAGNSPGPGSGTASGSSSAPSSSRRSGCPAPPGGGGPRGVPKSAPRTTWERWGSVVAPRTAAGPFVTSATLRRCYAQTETGAMVAAANSAIGFNADPPIARAMLQSQLTPGPNKVEALKDPGGGPRGDRSMRVIGVRVQSYTGSQATVELVLDFGQSAYMALPTTLVWADGDWKVDSSAMAPAAAITSLEGYIPWQAGS